MDNSTTYSDKYTIIDAAKKAIGSSRLNAKPVCFFACIGSTLSILITLAIITIAVRATYTPSFINYVMFHPGWYSEFLTILLLAFYASVIIVVMACFSSFILATIGLLVKAGVDGNKVPFKAALKAGQHRTFRMFKASLILCFIILLPLFVAFCIGSAIAIVTQGQQVVIYTIGAIGLIITAFIASRLAIMPMVALFENIPLRKLYSRTTHLMSGGGIWFAVQYAGVMLVMILITRIFSGHIFFVGRGSYLIWIIVVTTFQQAIFYIFYSAMFVVFYHHRRALKS